MSVSIISPNERRMKPILLTHLLRKPALPISTTRILHALIIKSSLSHDPLHATKILRFYAINADLTSAQNLFDQIPHPNIHLWNAIIRAYAQAHRFPHAFALFSRLLTSSQTSCPDNYTFACLARACRNPETLRVVHGQVVGFGLGLDFICCSALVSCYSKLAQINDARRVFDRIELPDLVLWNAMIAGYGRRGDCWKGIELLKAMLHMGVEPDDYTVVGLVTGLVDMKLGEMMQGFCFKHGFDSNGYVGSALVKMYSAWKDMDSAFGVFNNLLNPDLVSWSSLITGYSRAGDPAKAIFSFKKLAMNNGRVDRVLLASVLAACGDSATVQLGCEIHGYAVRHELSTDVVVSSALIDMYAKCGFLEMGMKVFQGMPERNIVSYNTMISSLGLHGRSKEAFLMFGKILEEGLKPDELTFVGVLCACCHSGLVREGREWFEKMTSEFGVEPRTEHFVYMVKLLGMDAKLWEAYDFVRSLPEPVDCSVWGALLSCCDPQKDCVMAEIIGEHLVGKESKYNVMLSNFFAGDGRWEVVKSLRGDDYYGGGFGGKVPGKSWISW